MIIFSNSSYKEKNDILFLKTFFPNISDNEINEISIIKDELFIKYLKNTIKTL